MTRIFTRALLGCLLGATAGVSALRAEVVSTTGVMIDAAGWVLTPASGIADCAAIELGDFGAPIETRIDEVNDLAALRAATSGPVSSLPLAPSRLRAGDPMLVVGTPLRSSRDRLAATTGRVSEITGDGGDSTRFQFTLEDRVRVGSAIVVNAQGHVLGLIPDRERLGRSGSSALRAEILALFMDLRDIPYATGRTNDRSLNANRVFERASQALLQVNCLDAEAVAARNPPTGGGLGSQGMELAAQAFSEHYLEAWSSPNDVALAFMATTYADQVMYFGRNTRRSAVQDDKRRFAQRWPARAYVLEPGSLRVNCTRSTCTVSGRNTYFSADPASGRTSSGVAEFSYDLEVRTGLITREDSSVISRAAADPAGLIALWQRRAAECAGRNRDCSLRDYSESVLDAFAICARADRRATAACPADTPRGGGGRDVALTADSAGSFDRGATTVVVAQWDGVDFSRDGILEVFVTGSMKNFDPGTPGWADFQVQIGDMVLAVPGQVQMAGNATVGVDLSGRYTLRRDGVPRGPQTVTVSYRTNARSIHTAHQTTVNLRVTPFDR